MNIYSWTALVLYGILISISHGFKCISFYNHQLFEIRKPLQSSEIFGVGCQFHLYAVIDFLKIYYNRNRTKCSITIIFALMAILKHKRFPEVVLHVQLV